MVSAMTTGEERSRKFSTWWRETGESELRQLLYWVWDPLGFNENFPDAVDEYNGYALEIVTALASDIPESAVMALLASIEQNRMGITRQSLQPIAEQLHTWHQRSMQRWASRRLSSPSGLVAGAP